jgi:hypothetical protein
MELETFWKLSVSEVRDRATALGMRPGDYFDSVLASLSTAAGVVPNSAQSS